MHQVHTQHLQLSLPQEQSRRYSVSRRRAPAQRVWLELLLEAVLSSIVETQPTMIIL